MVAEVSSPCARGIADTPAFGGWKGLKFLLPFFGLETRICTPDTPRDVTSDFWGPGL